MTYKHHTASYELGNRELNPDERVVVCTHNKGPEARRIARHFGLSPRHPLSIFSHKIWSDGEFMARFATKKSLDNSEFSRYLSAYQDESENPRYGYGLKGKTVYIVHTYCNELTPEDLVKRSEIIAQTAKYQGAEAVVLLAYTLTYGASERGVHDLEHPRMQKKDALKKYDGEGHTLQFQMEHYLISGVDKIIVAHAHSPEDMFRTCREANQEYQPMHQRSQEINSTKRYHLECVNVDLAPCVGIYVSDFGVPNLGFDLSDGGKKVLFMGPDVGIKDFVLNVQRNSGLYNSARALMNKKRAEDGSSLELLELVESEGLDSERGIEGMDVILMDDSIRSGGTMQNNIAVLRGEQVPGLKLDSRIKGRPRKVAVYATRTNFSGISVQTLGSKFIDDIILTNADPRAMDNWQELDQKAQVLWINFLMAEAAKAVERGEDPNKLLTPDYIRSRNLLRISIPHGHKSLMGTDGLDGMI